MSITSPIMILNNLGLWEEHKNQYYWQTDKGYGDEISEKIYSSIDNAVKALNYDEVEFIDAV